MQLRLAMNGGVDGNVVPKIMMTDGCGKLMRGILEELIMQPDSDSEGGWIRRKIFTTHLLCLFHLWLNLKECIRQVFRQSTGFAPEWRSFEHLFFTIAHQTLETEVDRLLEQLHTKLESWISSRSESNPSIL